MTEKEKVQLEMYINFLYTDSSPCDSCDPRSKAECCGCWNHAEWKRRADRYNVGDLLKDETIAKYVNYSVNVLKTEHSIKNLSDKLKNFMHERDELLSKIDVKPSGKASFHCPDCDMDFAVPIEKCTNAVRSGKTIFCYRCPICKQTRFSNDDEAL